MSLSSEEIERYARHIVLPEIGGAGQQKLKAARIVVLGAGGLGAPVLLYLAAAGVGHLTIIDDDVVSLSNLQRQILHSTAKIGALKTDSAETALRAINSHVSIQTHATRLKPDNAKALLEGHDLAIDGSDNFATRFAMADQCERLGMPLVTGAVTRFDGNLTVLAPHMKNASGAQNPNYRDLVPDIPPPDLVPSCAEAGILGAVTGVIGTLQAMEAIKWITGAGKPLIGRLLLYDGLDGAFRTMRYDRKV